MACKGRGNGWRELIYLYDLAGNAAGDLVRGKGLDMFGLKAGDTLGSFDTNRYLGFLGAFYLGVDEHVFFQGIDVGI